MALQLAREALLALLWTRHVGKPHLTQPWHRHLSRQLLNSNNLLVAICSASRESRPVLLNTYFANLNPSDVQQRARKSFLAID